MAVRFGLFVPQGWKMDLVGVGSPVEQYEAMTAVAKAADADPAWDSVWLYDHFHTVPEPTMETTFECWTATATLARDTERVKIGQMVGCNGYRHPALYAKIASTVDVASHGRLYAGIGAGWYEHEWRAYGFGGEGTEGNAHTSSGGFPAVPERMGMLREAVEVVHRMWTEDTPSFKGRRYAIDGPINEPKNARGTPEGKIPLWIGGGGEKVTLRLVAQYGDACNIGRDAETVRRKLDVLKGHCDDVERDYDEIVKSAEADVVLIEPGTDPEEATASLRGKVPFGQYAATTVVGTPETVRAHLAGLVEAGIDYVIVYMPRLAHDREPMERFAREVIPHFA